MHIVMSHQHNRLSLNKRPLSFLGNDSQLRKDFGTNSKKPRLDITLTPSCSTKYPLDESSFNISNADPYDDLWEEDLSEEVVEECFLLASQASQSCPEPPAGSFCSKANNNQQRIVLRQPVDVGSSKFKVPSAFQTSKLQPPGQKFKPKKPSNMCVTTEKTSASFPVSSAVVPVDKLMGHGLKTIGSEEDVNSILPEGLYNLKEENDRLRDSVLLKEGEVSLLRSQIKKLQMQLETQHQESARETQLQTKKFTEQIDSYRKELEITKTELQFKIIEATAVESHSKIVESASKLKLVEPEAAVLDTSHATEHMFGKRSPHKSQTHLLFGEINECADSLVKPRFTHQLQQLPQISEGAKLSCALSESLQDLPKPDVDWVHYVTQTEKFRSTVETAREINTKIVALQHHACSIHSCIAQIIKLVGMTSLSSPEAGHLINQVVLVCREVICRQVHILRLLQQVQSSAEWHELDERVASIVGTMASSEDADPLTSKSWYYGEQGIETRRAFGLLEALCGSSQLAADLISGTSAFRDVSTAVILSQQMSSSSSDSIVRKLESNECATPVKVVASSVESSDTEMESDNTQSSQDVIMEPQAGPSSLREHVKGVDTELHLLLKQLPTIPRISAPDKIPIDLSDYASDQHGFLRLCQEAASQISLQRRTQGYIGVLSCMVKMLRSVALRSSFTKKGLQIILEIIRDVVFSCPQADVVAAIVSLLANMSQHIFVMDNLCQGSSNSTLVDRQLNEVIYFTRESCVLQVLFRLVPSNGTSLSFRTSLCSNLVGWLAGLIFQQKKETVWMRATGRLRECSCKAKLIHTLVTALYESFNDLQELHSQGQHSAMAVHLGRHLCVGVRLLHGLLQQDELIGSYLDGVEGQYQLFLTGLRDAEDVLTMTDTERKCLKELLEVEIVTSDGVIAVPVGEEQTDSTLTNSDREEESDDDSLWKKLNTVLKWDTNVRPTNI